MKFYFISEMHPTFDEVRVTNEFDEVRVTNKRAKCKVSTRLVRLMLVTCPSPSYLLFTGKVVSFEYRFDGYLLAVFYDAHSAKQVHHLAFVVESDRLVRLDK